MQRFNQELELGISDGSEINRRTAFHEAGHAAAIYLENRRKNLPLIYFQIQTRKYNSQATPFFSEICGGRQISDALMIGGKSSTGRCDCTDITGFTVAYEADIINFLAGPLAEAKYECLRSHEVFNINVLRPDALKNYGGNADLKEVWFYLRSFLPSLQEQERKLNELFSEAFHFIQEFDNWKHIVALAQYIFDSTEEFICYEQVNQVFNQYKQYTGIQSGRL
jgi:hypothetical protein